MPMKRSVLKVSIQLTASRTYIRMETVFDHTLSKHAATLSEIAQALNMTDTVHHGNISPAEETSHACCLNACPLFSKKCLRE